MILRPSLRTALVVLTLCVAASAQQFTASGDSTTGVVTIGVTGAPGYDNAKVVVKDGQGNVVLKVDLVPGDILKPATVQFEIDTPGAALTVEVEFTGPTPVVPATKSGAVSW